MKTPAIIHVKICMYIDSEKFDSSGTKALLFTGFVGKQILFWALKARTVQATMEVPLNWEAQMIGIPVNDLVVAKPVS